jgi:hypothetical protein
MSDLSFSDMQTLVSAAINKNKTSSNSVWITDMYDSYVIYSDYSMKTYLKRTYVIDDNNVVTLGDPKTVIRKTSYESVTLSTGYFDLDDSVIHFNDDNSVVIREGKIFEAGEYKDKNFTLDEIELSKAVESFNPCDIDYQHIAGPLDGQFGKLDKVWIGDDKKTLFGSVSIPKWLDSILPIKKVSATWNRANKTIQGLALVTNPRVVDAAVMAAFAGSRHSSADQSDIQKIHDIAVSQGATCGDNAEMQQGEDMPINQTELLDQITDRVKAIITPKIEVIEGQAATISAESKFSEDPEYKAFKTQMDRMQQSLASEKALRIRDNAVSFAKSEIAANRALPSVEDSIIFQYMQSALDDETIRDQVSFSVNGKTEKGTRVDALTALFAARTAHTLTNSQIKVANKGGSNSSSTDNMETTGIDEDRKKKLMNMTPLGKAVQTSVK